MRCSAAWAGQLAEVRGQSAGESGEADSLSHGRELIYPDIQTFWDAAAAHYGVVIRTVEAPFFRRVVAQRRAGSPPPGGALYTDLSARLGHLLGAPAARPSAHTAATRDGKGILFVAHNGDVYPAGFLPVGLGSIRDQPLRTIYRDHALLHSIRAAQFAGCCGRCEYADLCGGSRARAYAATGDPLADDPACTYQPPPRGNSTAA
jgi:radical SAM protein with 4Fe4S-binding SPASM domain